jgi:hypothetical protein
MKFNITLDRDEDGVWISDLPALITVLRFGESNMFGSED